MSVEGFQNTLEENARRLGYEKSLLDGDASIEHISRPVVEDNGNTITEHTISIDDGTLDLATTDVNTKNGITQSLKTIIALGNNVLIGVVIATNSQGEKVTYLSLFSGSSGIGKDAQRATSVGSLKPNGEPIIINKEALKQVSGFAEDDSDIDSQFDGIPGGVAYCKISLKENGELCVEDLGSRGGTTLYSPKDTRDSFKREIEMWSIPSTDVVSLIGNDGHDDAEVIGSKQATEIISGPTEDSYFHFPSLHGLRDRERRHDAFNQQVRDITDAIEGKSPEEKLHILTSSLYENNKKKIPEKEGLDYSKDPANATQEAIMQVYGDVIRGFRDLRPDIVAALFAHTYAEYLGNCITEGHNIDEFANGQRPTIMPRDMAGQLFLALELAASDLAASDKPSLVNYSSSYFAALKETVRCEYSGEEPKPNSALFGNYFSDDPETRDTIDIGYLEAKLAGADNNPTGFAITDEETRSFLEVNGLEVPTGQRTEHESQPVTNPSEVAEKPRDTSTNGSEGSSSSKEEVEISLNSDEILVKKAILEAFSKIGDNTLERIVRERTAQGEVLTASFLRTKVNAGLNSEKLNIDPKKLKSFAERIDDNGFYKSNGTIDNGAQQIVYEVVKELLGYD